MRDHAADVFHTETGRPWSAPRGSLVSSKRTASVIAATDFLAARRQRRTDAHNPQGPIVIFSGGADCWFDDRLIWGKLDEAKSRNPKMVLATTAQDKGCDAMAAAWAASRKVTLITFRLSAKLGKTGGVRTQRPDGRITSRRSAGLRRVGIAIAPCATRQGEAYPGTVRQAERSGMGGAMMPKRIGPALPGRSSFLFLERHIRPRSGTRKRARRGRDAEPRARSRPPARGFAVLVAGTPFGCGLEGRGVAKTSSVTLRGGEGRGGDASCVIVIGEGRRR
jgi:hypothetical protein